MIAPSPQLLAWAARCISPTARVVHSRRLGGATGPSLLELRDGTTEVRAVLRVGDPHGPTVRGRLDVEASALQLAERHGIGAPRLIGSDLTGEVSGQPAILSSFLDGTSTIPLVATGDRLVELGRAAGSLSRAIAQEDGALPVRVRPLADLDFTGDRATGRSTALLDTAHEQVASMVVPAGATILIHGDCWQGNTVWSQDRFAGFVDWDAAGVGPSGLDLGSLRFDVALYFGVSHIGAVHDGWTSVPDAPQVDLVYWDLVAALSSPADLTEWMPVIKSPGRHDLDLRIVAARRDEFIRSALDRLDRSHE